MATSLLLADDSPTIAKILGMALQSEDYEIRSVLNADDAVRELKANPPFFFLVDLTLPGKDGFAFAEMIRNDSKLAKIKVVLLSSAFEPVDEEAVKACGADLVIAKPFDPSELRASLRQIKDAPPKFPSGSKVQGSLSGQAIKAPERTSLTDTSLSQARDVISGPAPEELLLGMQNDGDANSILASLAENAPPPAEFGIAEGPAISLEAPSGEPESAVELGNADGNATAMLDLSGGMPASPIPETVLDLSGSFGTPSAGTNGPGLSANANPGELVLGDEPPAFKPSTSEAPPSFKKPSPPPDFKTPAAPSAPEADLSPNAAALAAFFSAEIDAKQSSDTPPSPPPANEPEEFDASLASIEWENSSPADLDAWSASSQPAAPSVPPRSAPPTAPPRSAPVRSGASNAQNSPGSFLFDTGGSNFRFAEDYINRITKAFVGHPAEELPKEHTEALFPQASSDAPRASAGTGAANWNPVDAQKMEQIVREEVQMAVREVVEKIAWEIIPELAENLIKKELEKVMKQMES
ncbi:MAG: response regulator [Bacteriovoracia bacterium]